MVSDEARGVSREQLMRAQLGLHPARGGWGASAEEFKAGDDITGDYFSGTGEDTFEADKNWKKQNLLGGICTNE